MLSVLQGAAAAKRSKRQACGKQAKPELGLWPQLHRIRDLTATSPEHQMQAGSLLETLGHGSGDHDCHEGRTAMKAGWLCVCFDYTKIYMFFKFR